MTRRGWAGASARYTGDARAYGGPVTPTLRHEIVMELGSNEAMPIFLCEPLQTPMVIPVFVDRREDNFAVRLQVRRRTPQRVPVLGDRRENNFAVRLQALIHNEGRLWHTIWLLRMVPS